MVFLRLVILHASIMSSNVNPVGIVASTAPEDPGTAPQNPPPPLLVSSGGAVAATVGGSVGAGTGVLVGGTGVLVGGTGVLVGGTGDL